MIGVGSSLSLGPHAAFSLSLIVDPLTAGDAQLSQL